MNDITDALKALTQDSRECVLIYRMGDTWWVGKGETDIAGMETPFAWGYSLPAALTNLQDGRVLGPDTVLRLAPELGAGGSGC